MYKTVGKKFRRALHFDFHTPPTIDNIFGNFDAEKFAEQLEGAHIEYINFTARCNMGYSYYNTKVGKKYEGLGERDVLAEVLTACHKRGIGVTAYLNVGLDHELAADNTNWLKIDKNGRIYKDDKVDNFFRNMCYNSDYREHLLAEIKELGEYDIDGLFCDCVQKSPCYCPRCTADMRAKGFDVSCDDDVIKYQTQVAYELCREIRNSIPHKELKFYFNAMHWNYDLDTHAEIECLPTGVHWGYDYFDSLAAFARPLFEDRVYMSGRFQNDWGDFGGVKPIASMQNDLYDAMMNSFGLSYGDHLHPVDGFEDEVVSRIKTVMEEKMLYEPYTDNSENVLEVGVMVKAGTRKMPPYVKGIARALKELKISYNAYDGYADFSQLKLLIIGEDIEADNAMKERIVSFAKCGGKIIFTGSAIDLGYELGLLDYIDLIGKDERDNAFYTTDKSNMRWAMYSPSRLIKNINGEEKAKYIDNYFNLIWDGRQSYFYRPQGKPTEYSAAVIGKNSACICFDIFKAYAENFLSEHRELLSDIIDTLLPDRLVKTENMPRYAGVALTQNDKHLVLHVKSTYPEIKMGRGIIEDHVYMRSSTVSVKGEYSVSALPTLEKIEARIENGRTVFETGDILGYKAFLLNNK